MIKYEFEIKDSDVIMLKIRRRRNIFLSGLMLFFILILVLLLLSTDLFNITKITVFGNQKLSYNDIIELSGINKGQNIFEVDKREVEKKLETNPYIVVKNIKRRLPNELVITIAERQEAMMIEVSDGYMLLDKEGVCLSHIDKKGQWMLPVVVGMDDIKVDMGQNVAEISDKGKALVTLFECISQWDLGGSISHIDIQSEYDIILMTDWGLQIRMGDTLRLDEKSAWIKAVLNDLKEKGQPKPKGVLDVAYAGQAVYTPLNR